MARALDLTRYDFFDEGLDYWEQQPKEPDDAYAHFLAYREIGPERTFRSAVEPLGLKYDTVRAKARRYHWKERAEAFDAHMGVAKPASEKQIVFADDRDLWDQQPGESLKRWNQFLTFRDLGRTRTLKRAAEKLTLGQATIRQYSYAYRWNQRCEAFDRHMDDQWRTAMYERQRQAAQHALGLSKKYFDRINTWIDAFNPLQMTASDGVRFTEMHNKLVRYALGEPETTVGLTGGRSVAEPVAVTDVPGSEEARQQRMEAATAELARRLGQGTLDAEDVLDLLD